MDLKPSNIFYTQNCINNIFRKKCPHGTIGDTLDDLYYRRTLISNIPKITVVKKDGKWFTLDNRRLWIYHHLEGAGKLDTIPVNVGTEISSRKYTTNNGGVSVKIHLGRDPGGKCRKYITPVRPRVPESEIPKSPNYADENDCDNETAKKPVEDLPATIPITSTSVGNNVVPSTNESPNIHDIKAEPATEENGLNILGNTQEVLKPDNQTKENTEFKIHAIQVSTEEENEQYSDSQETVKKPVEDVPAIIQNTQISIGNDIVVPSTHGYSDKPDIQAESALEENVLNILDNTHNVFKPDNQTEENMEFKVKASQASTEEEQHADSRDSLSLKSLACSSTENAGVDNSDTDGDQSESIKDNVTCNGTRGIKRSVSTTGEHEDGAAERKRAKLD